MVDLLEVFNILLKKKSCNFLIKYYIYTKNIDQFVYFLSNGTNGAVVLRQRRSVFHEILDLI